MALCLLDHPSGSGATASRLQVRSATRLQFEPHEEQDYQKYHFQQSIAAIRVGLAVGLGLYAAFGLLDHLSVPEPQLFALLVIRFAVILPIGLLLLAWSFHSTFERVWVRAVATGALLAGAGILAMIVLTGMQAYYAGLLLVLFWTCIFCRLPFRVSAAVCLAYTIAYLGWSFYDLSQEAPRQQLWWTPNGQNAVAALLTNTFFLLAADLVGLAGSFQMEWMSRHGFLHWRAVQRAQAKADTLVHDMLPRSVARRLLDERAVIADRHENVSVLFADVVGFSDLARRVPPEDLVRFLNRIFSAFDALAEWYGAEKVKTIGDAYMAVVGLPEQRADHAVLTAELALGMMSVVRNMTCPDGSPVRMRVGIHSGPVVAGVIGLRRTFYDVWGDTVNIAQRLESSGEPDEIQLSRATAAQLGEGYLLQRRARLCLKGVGEVETLWLRGRMVDCVAHAAK